MNLSRIVVHSEYDAGNFSVRDLRDVPLPFGKKQRRILLYLSLFPHSQAVYWYAKKSLVRLFRRFPTMSINSLPPSQVIVTKILRNAALPIARSIPSRTSTMLFSFASGILQAISLRLLRSVIVKRQSVDVVLHNYAQVASCVLDCAAGYLAVDCISGAVENTREFCPAGDIREAHLSL